MPREIQFLKDAPEEIRGISAMARWTKRNRKTIERHLKHIPHAKIFGQTVFYKSEVQAAIQRNSGGNI